MSSMLSLTLTCCRVKREQLLLFNYSRNRALLALRTRARESTYSFSLCPPLTKYAVRFICCRISISLTFVFTTAISFRRTHCGRPGACCSHPAHSTHVATAWFLLYVRSFLLLCLDLSMLELVHACGTALRGWLCKCLETTNTRCIGISPNVGIILSRSSVLSEVLLSCTN